jgi:hypothetical protein
MIDTTKKVFLGGTCNNSKWREQHIPKLKIAYFNPDKGDSWSEEDAAEELKQREECDYLLYFITPRMTGVYSIAEVIDDSNKRPERTIFMFIETDASNREIEVFSKHQIKSLIKVGEMVERNGGTWCKTIDELIEKLK